MDKIFSTLKDIATTSFIPFIYNDSNQNSSPDLIYTLPTLIEGYLTSGQEFEQRKDFLSALMIYSQGLNAVPPPSPSTPAHSNTKEKYLQLQKAKQNALKRFMKKSTNGIFEWSLLPNEVLSLIFNFLDIGDLLVCTSICVEWFEFIMDWSEFWDKLLPKIPHMNKATIASIMRRQSKTFCLVGPMDLDVLHGILFCLACPSRSVGLTSSNYENCCFVQELYFDHIFITDIGSTLLEQALRSIGPELKRVEFVSCDTANNQVFKLLSRSPSFHNVAYVSISLTRITKMAFSSNDYNKHYLYTLPSDTEKKLPNPTFKYLSYLKLVPIALFSYNHTYGATLQHIAQIICQSPNLCELIVDADIPFDDGIHIALKQHNPNLQYLTVCSKSTRNIQPVISSTSNHNYRNYQYSNINYVFNGTSSSSSSHKKINDNNNTLITATPSTNLTTNTTKGLRTLIFSDLRGIKLRMVNNHCAGLFKKNFKTLEVLWIRCELGHRLLTELVSCGCPNLREINFSFLLYGGSFDEFCNLLKTFFSKCTALEAITIDSREPGIAGCGKRTHSLAPDKTLILIPIAQYCTQLQNLCVIDGQNRYPNHIDMDFFLETIQEFNIHSKLTYLEAHLYWEKAMDTVRQLKELKTLCLPMQTTPTLPEQLIYPEHLKEKLEKILSERGGGLIYN
ncbi:hypothetical protein BDA99DRAFT_575281 [Phascolomyces articulosus]|uniref:F-box domain-containing protein n=1 Tax=Phascolomyces articulosus TaxID=60185 RepID=A0AAD5PBA0_9FUNG|nr:hypothetical protein BDA99DRAFT_575281 [Phascolomyces articulosus]